MAAKKLHRLDILLCVHRNRSIAFTQDRVRSNRTRCGPAGEEEGIRTPRGYWLAVNSIKSDAQRDLA
jgi:hypothetical protein